MWNYFRNHIHVSCFLQSHTSLVLSVVSQLLVLTLVRSIVFLSFNLNSIFVDANIDLSLMTISVCKLTFVDMDFSYDFWNPLNISSEIISTCSWHACKVIQQEKVQTQCDAEMIRWMQQQLQLFQACANNQHVILSYCLSCFPIYIYHIYLLPRH